MKNILTTAAVLFSMTAFAQVGINNTSPKATLDITAKTSGTKPEGLIIPQLAGSDIHTATAAAVYGAAQKGLIIYASSADTAPAGATASITTAGYYYFDGTNWQKISTGNTVSTSLASGNILVGNASNVATAVTPTGDVTISNTGVTSIGSGKVTNSQMASAAALTVKGNATNAAAAPTDISAGTDGYVLRRSGTALGFGTVATAGIADGAVTAAKLNQMSATSGQVLGWNGTAWTPTANGVSTTLNSGNIYVGNASNVATAVSPTGDVTITNAGVTSVDKLKGKTLSATAPTNGQVLKYNTTTSAWEPAADTDTNTTYTGSTSINLNGTSFERTALTGDVSAAANSNATTVAGIQGRSVSNTAPTTGQVLGWNGSSWAPAADANTTYTGSTSINLNGTSFERTALTGDVTASANSNATTIAANAVTSAKIADGTVANADLANMAALTVKGNATNAAATPTDIAAGTDGYVLRRSGTVLGFGTVDTAGITDGAVTSNKILDATVANADLDAGVGGIYKGSGALSGNTTVAQGGSTLAFTSTATNGFSVDGTTLSVDAANNAVGIGTAAPNTNAALDISSTTKGVKLPSLALTATNNASPLSAHIAGMLVYNTATAGTAPNNVVPGLYTNDGTQWILLQTPQTVNTSAPAGTVSYTAASTVPTGYLECNGAAVSRTTYATLYAAIGTTYGAGNGSTTFNLPDLRGEFVRGWDHGRGVDVSRTLGSTQTATRIANSSDYSFSPYGDPQTGLQLSYSNSRPYTNVICNDNGEDLKSRTDSFNIGFTAQSVGSFNLTWYNWPSRPRNISLMPIIKY